MRLSEEFVMVLDNTARRLGVELNQDWDDVRTYAAGQMINLSAALGEPRYSEILVAAGLNVALKSVAATVESADAIDKELVGTITGMLAMGARALMVA